MCAALCALYAIVLVRTAWMSDDAYITLRTVDNFVHGYGLRWNVAERVQTFTHPLWLILITPFYGVTREAFFTTIGLSIAVSLAAVVTIVLDRRKDPWVGAVAIAALVGSKAFVDFSTSGLENPLTYLLLGAFVALWPEDAPSERRLFRLSLIAGLGVLTRPDNALLFGPALLLALVRHGDRRRALLCVARGTAPLAAWLIFSTLYYGIPYPNTALAKLSTGIPTTELIAQGGRYLANSLKLDPITLPLTACGAIAALASRRSRSVALAAGVFLYLAYVVRVGGDFMSGRLLAPPFFLAVLLLAEIPWGSSRWRAPAALAAIAVLSLAAPYPTVLSGSDYGLRLTDAIDRSGIADERRYYFAQSGWWNGQPGLSRPIAETRRAGRELREGGVPLTVDGAVGIVGYEAGPGVHIVDYHALGDPLLSRLPVVRRDPYFAAFLREFQFPETPAGWRPGHFLRAIPKGYLRTLATGTNTIEDRAIADLYDDTTILARAPLFAGARLETILRLLVSGPSAAIEERPRPDFTPIPWDELVSAQPGNAEARYARGNVRSRAGDAAGALEDFREAIRLDPTHGRALVAAASKLGEHGSWDEGLALLDRALRLDPEDAHAWRYRALLLDGQGRPRDAIEALERAARLDPRLAADMDANIGLEYAKLHDNASALSWLNRAEASDPRLARTSLLKGKVLALQNRPAEADAAFTHALALDPSLERAALDLSSLRAGQGDRAGAIAALDGFLKSNPKSAEVLFREGQILAAYGNSTLAAERLRAAAALGHAGAREALQGR